MYTLNEYGHMLADSGRRHAYTEALGRVISPGAVVVEIGTGVGYFAIIAARLGASRVYAMECSPCITIADEVIKANGGGPIQLIRARSTQIALTEQVDVIVSDLRGSVPVFADHLATIEDARSRFLKPGGRLVPETDRLWVALVSSEALYARTVGVWDGIDGDFSMRPAREAQASSPIKARLMPSELVSDTQLWQVLNYYTASCASLSGAITLTVTGDCVAHGMGMWFDTDLVEGVGYSNHPAKPPRIYGQMFFPWPTPVILHMGEQVFCSIRADVRDDVYAWTWETVASAHTFVQSTQAQIEAVTAGREG